MTDEKPQARPFYEPGWYPDLSNADYHGSFGWSSSRLKVLNEMTPAHLVGGEEVPDGPATNKDLGTAFHALVLQPDKFTEEVAVLPDNLNLRTKADKKVMADFCDEHEGKAIITVSQFKAAQAMAKSAMTHPRAAMLLADGVPESSVYWWYKTMDNDEIEAGEQYKEMVKVRPDWLCTGHSVVVDLKSTVDASYSGFIRTIQKFYYHHSAAMYLEGVNQCKELLEATGHMAYTGFVFIVTESKPPYLTAVYDLSREYLELGKLLHRQALRILRDAKENGWPGYPDDIRTLEPPPWALRGHIV